MSPTTLDLGCDGIDGICSDIVVNDPGSVCFGSSRKSAFHESPIFWNSPSLATVGLDQCLTPFWHSPMMVLKGYEPTL